MTIAPIEINIPLPPPKPPKPKRPVGRPRKWPWRELEVGQSFVLTGWEKASVIGGCHQKGAYYKRKYIFAVLDEAAKMYRVWRTA